MTIRCRKVFRAMPPLLHMGCASSLCNQRRWQGGQTGDSVKFYTPKFSPSSSLNNKPALSHTRGRCRLKHTQHGGGAAGTYARHLHHRFFSIPNHVGLGQRAVNCQARGRPGQGGAAQGPTACGHSTSSPNSLTPYHPLCCNAEPTHPYHSLLA